MSIHQKNTLLPSPDPPPDIPELPDPPNLSDKLIPVCKKSNHMISVQYSPLQKSNLITNTCNCDSHPDIHWLKMENTYETSLTFTEKYHIVFTFKFLKYKILISSLFHITSTCTSVHVQCT